MASINAVTSADVVEMYKRFPYPPPGWGQGLAKFLPPGTQGLRILDAGCGTGEGTGTMARAFPQCDFVGVDLTEESIRRATRTFEKETNLQFRIADLTKNLEFLGDFDVIYCMGVLHHLPDPQLGLENLSSLARNGGRFFLFLYALYGRLRVERVRGATRLLTGPSDSMDTKLEVARELVRSFRTYYSLPARARRWVKSKTGLRGGSLDIDDADQFVNPIVHYYTVDSLKALLDSCGMQLQRFLPDRAGNLVDDSRLVPSRLRDRYLALDRWGRFAVQEFLQLPANFTFEASLH